MKKTIPITLTILGLIIAGVFTILQPDEIIQPQALAQLKFEKEDILLKVENIEITTTSDEFGNIIQTGIRVPIKYNFPIATTTGYITKEIKEFVSMNLDGYTGCRSKGKTQLVCKQELVDDMEQTVLAEEENIQKRLDELKREVFRDEIDITDFQ